MIEETPNLSRREFFRFGVDSLAEARDKASEKLARHWFRPPYALAELDFLNACTSCGDCIKACPIEVLFPLPVKYGLRAENTPAMDLMNKGCLLCEDWACVNSCETGALSRAPEARAPEKYHPKEEEEEQTDEENIPLPLLAMATIDQSQCIAFSGPECGACKHVCPVPDALLWDGPMPRINPQLCVGCGLCREACIVVPKAILLIPAQRLREKKEVR